MLSLIKRFNNWLRDLILDDVDKEYDKPFPHHRGFGSRRNPVDRIEERFKRQKARNRYY